MKKDYKTTAIILSAGNGKRMQSNIPKQMIEIDSTPIIIRTLKIFDKCEKINDIILVINKDYLLWYMNAISVFNITKKIQFAIGGENRYDSVISGLDMVDSSTDFICIHDGVRCLLKENDLNAILDIAYDKDNCIAIQNSTDTLKTIDNNGIILKSLDRNCTIQAQTPQVFKKEIFELAIKLNKLNSTSITDDSMLIENIGKNVYTYNCGKENIKITTVLDLDIAEIIIKRRNEANYDF